MIQVIEVAYEELTKHKLLFCVHCGTWTRHVLSRSFEYYACQCGTCVEVDLLDEVEESI